MLPALVMLLVVSLSSCKSTFLLKEDFAGDVVGNTPIKNIPGDPAGDSVAYTSVISPRLAIQFRQGAKRSFFLRHPLRALLRSTSGFRSRELFLTTASPSGFTGPPNSEVHKAKY
jgi:hypothetical protein